MKWRNQSLLIGLLVSVLLGIVMSGNLFAVKVKPEALAEAQRWMKAKFEGTVETGAVQPGLIVIANHDAVLQNTRGEGRPLTIAGKTYTRGLYCHAVSKVIVRLPGGGKTFSAIIGVDSNPQTADGKGSVVFAVNIGDKVSFRSEVMREGMAGVPINVDLKGAGEFILEVGDAGDGIACDQSDWAEAKVVLENGEIVWLGDLPIIDREVPAPTAEPPFSFVYDGQPSAQLLKEWDVKRHSGRLDDQRTSHTLTYTDPKTGLVVRCQAVEYHDFPTLEWTVYFQNTGTKDTPVLSGIQAIDTWFYRSKNGEFLLHHNTGSPCTPQDYQPFETPLPASSTQRITTAGGRSTNSNLPYFNIQWPDQGVIVVIGWPGQWAAEFNHDEGTGLHVRGGQELTHFLLHPGEEVRAPLVVVQFWKGDYIDSQNLWRRWMLAYNTPHPGGKPMPPGYMICTSDFYPGMKSTAADEIQNAIVYVKARVKLDYWWIDAGWYPCGDGWWNVGTWQPDPQRYPKGLKEVSDYVHSNGIKLVVWFEPERVTAGSWLAENHPEWVLGGKNGGLLNLGNPEALAWLIEHVDTIITKEGIDLYRQDFNMDPLGYWRVNDAPDRQGITEIRHIEGYLAYWDELQRRHPDMPIDSCASGGRRNDIETLRRAVPLLRSDYRFEPVGTQGHNYGMSLWMPYNGTGVMDNSDYVVRSHWCPWLSIGREQPRREGLEWTDYFRKVAQWRKISGYMLGDYYPLTAYNLDNTLWLGWQFDRPEQGEGMVQAFRRAESMYESGRMPLRGLEPEAPYTVTNLDTGKSEQIGGLQLMQEGLLIVAPLRPSAAVYLYKREVPEGAAEQ